MTETVRIGVIGLGNIANIHCGNLQQLDQPVSIVAGVDVDADARRQFAEMYDAAVYEEATAMFDTVDAVLVTTPNRYHEQYVVAALEAGLDVLVEKPLAHTLESAERMGSAAETADGFCMVGFHNRFADPVQTLVGYRDAGDIGEVTHIEANYIRRRGVPGRGSWFTRNAVAGGGSLIDIGAHSIDLALHVAGHPEVVEVSGDTRSQFGVDEEYAYVQMWGEDRGAAEFSVDDSASAFIRCGDGTTISLEVAWATNRPDSQEYYVRGSEAGAKLNLADQSLTLFETANKGVMHHRTTDIETQRTDPKRHELAQFVAAVRDGTPPSMNTVEQALRVQRVMDAIYRSSESGAAVSISDTDP